jgi:hypothetical protein
MKHPKHPNSSETVNSDRVKASETSGGSITPDVRITPGGQTGEMSNEAHSTETIFGKEGIQCTHRDATPRGCSCAAPMAAASVGRAVMQLQLQLERILAPSIAVIHSKLQAFRSNHLSSTHQFVEPEIRPCA